MKREKNKKIRNWKSKIGNGLASLAIAGAVIGGNVNCVTSGPYYGNYSSVDTFVCNRWIDSDQNGQVSLSELRGVKNSFRANEPITLVSVLGNRQGMKLGINLYNGAGKLVSDDEQIVPFYESVYQLQFNSWELYNKGGEGSYRVEWSLNGKENVFSVDNFNLIK